MTPVTPLEADPTAFVRDSLEDPEADVRKAAAAAAARLRLSHLVPALERLLGDPDNLVRVEATEALSAFQQAQAFIQCPCCRAESAPRAKYCFECGTPLSDPAAPRV